MKPGLRTFAFALLLAGACDHRPEDFDRVRTTAASFQENWSRRLDEIDARHAALQARAQALPADAPGINDALSRLTALQADLERLDQTLTGVTDSATAQLDARRRRLAEEALSVGERDLREATQQATAALDEVGAELDALESARAAAAAPPPPPPTLLTDPAFARTAGATASVPGIEFARSADRLDLANPATRAGLEQILAFAGTCDELRFSITAHTSKEGNPRVAQRLTEARARSVRKHLMEKGVPEAKIAQVRGAGGAEPLLAEPDPGSDEEKAMPAEDLARVRAQNQRISITVATPCAAPPS